METTARINITDALARLACDANIEPAERRFAYALDGIEPGAVVAPPDIDSLCEIMKFANAEQLTVFPCGSGTKRALGNVPGRVDIVLLMRHFNRILGHEAGDMTAFVEAGCLVRDVQSALGRKGQFLPLNPPHAAATIGGMIAANASGPWRCLYGTARDQVIGIKVVRPDGVVIKGGGRVVKNVAGYDLNKLYTGSLGTLGVIVEVNFKVRPLPVGQRMVVASFYKAEDAVAVCLGVQRSALQPMAIELLNGAAAISVGGAARLIADPDAVWAFFALEGVPAALERQERDIRRMCAEAGAGRIETITNAEAEAVWEKFRDLPASTIDAVAIKACVLPTQLAEAYDILEEIAEALNAAMLAHATTGILQVYGALCETLSPEEARRQIARAAEQIRSLGGHFVLEESPPELKRGFDVWGPARSDFRIMRGLKEELDPNRVLNPGRFVGGL